MAIQTINFEYDLIKYKMIRKYFLIFVILTLASSLYAKNNYSVTTTNLNIRSQANSNSEILDIINEGDTVENINIKDKWSEIKYKKTIGFVSSKYLREIEIISSPISNTFNDQKGFIAGFKFVFTYIFILCFLIIGSYKTYQLRRKDDRYKKGYREGNLSGGKLFRVVIICITISIISGLIGGILSIFH